MTSGIPQGSVLRPMFFFTIHINDLPDIVQNITRLFADDTQVYAVVNKEEEQNLQKDINNLLQWSDTWFLRFNIPKCTHVHLGHPSKSKYRMGDNEIKKVSEEKVMGIVIDDKLKFQSTDNKSKPET